jgi:hypothetical protein
MTLVAGRPPTFMPPAPVAARHVSEAVLVDHLARRMRAQWPLRAVGFEVKSHGRARTDVCVTLRDLHDSSPDVLVGVEAKLATWQRALRQAVLNRFSVDLSMIALPAYKVTGAVIEACWDQGVGVLAVDQKWLHVVVPATPAKPDAALRQKTLDQLTPMRARGTESVTALMRGM